MNSRKVNSIQLKASSHANFKMFSSWWHSFHIWLSHIILSPVIVRLIVVCCTFQNYWKLMIKNYVWLAYIVINIFSYIIKNCITPGTFKYNHSLSFLINKKFSKTINIKHWKNIPMNSCLKKIRHMFKYWDDQRKQENSHKWIL